MCAGWQAGYRRLETGMQPKKHCRGVVWTLALARGRLLTTYYIQHIGQHINPAATRNRHSKRVKFKETAETQRSSMLYMEVVGPIDIRQTSSCLRLPGPRLHPPLSAQPPPKQEPHPLLSHTSAYGKAGYIDRGLRFVDQFVLSALNSQFTRPDSPSGHLLHHDCRCYRLPGHSQGDGNLRSNKSLLRRTLEMNGRETSHETIKHFI